MTTHPGAFVADCGCRHLPGTLTLTSQSDEISPPSFLSSTAAPFCAVPSQHRTGQENQPPPTSMRLLQKGLIEEEGNQNLEAASAAYRELAEDLRQ